MFDQFKSIVNSLLWTLLSCLFIAAVIGIAYVAYQFR